MWQKFTAWLGKHSISSRTVASAWLFVVGLYYISTPFHDYATWVYTLVPKPIHGFIAGVVIPACMFWKTWKRGQQPPAPPPPPAPLNLEHPLNLEGNKYES